MADSTRSQLHVYAGSFDRNYASCERNEELNHSLSTSRTICDRIFPKTAPSGMRSEAEREYVIGADRP